MRANGRTVEVRYDAEEVNLLRMDLQQIPQELLQCRNLKKLHIYRNQIVCWRTSHQPYRSCTSAAIKLVLFPQTQFLGT